MWIELLKSIIRNEKTTGNKGLDQLKSLIKEETQKLVCETHENVCALRDQAYPKLEDSVIRIIFAEREPVSVQTALAELEQELSRSAGSETST